MPSERTIDSIRLCGEPQSSGTYDVYECGCAYRRHRGADLWRLCPYHEGFDDGQEELQALIDDFARAWAVHVATGSLEHFGSFSALLAATTKEYDRG